MSAAPQITVEPVSPGHWLVRLPDGTGLPMTASAADGKPRLRDVDFAAWLGFKDPRMIRKLIASMVRARKFNRSALMYAAERSPDGGRTALVCHLTREQALLVATQSGTPRAWEITELMVRVFDAVLDASRSPDNDTRAVFEGVLRDALRAQEDRFREQQDRLRHEVMAQLRAEKAVNTVALPFLDRRARPWVLAPIMAIARAYAGGDADRRRVMQERGRIDKRLRDALNWQRRWCFYPEHDFGRVASLLESEHTTATRFATELARAKQLSLVPRPKPPTRGDA